MTYREDTGHPDHVNYRDRRGNLIGHTHHTPSAHSVTAYDVLGRSRQFTFVTEAEDWIQQQYNTLGPDLIAGEDEPRLGETGRLIASADTQELVARRDKLQGLIGEVPPDVSELLARAGETLETARMRTAAAGSSTGNSERLERLEQAYEQLVEQDGNRTAWLEDHEPELREYKAIGDELRLRAEYRLSKLGNDREAIEVLGPSPGRNADEHTAAAWREAAEEYVAVEQRHGTVDLSDREATRQLRRNLEELEQTRQAERDLGGPTIQR